MNEIFAAAGICCHCERAAGEMKHEVDIYEKVKIPTKERSSYILKKWMVYDTHELDDIYCTGYLLLRLFYMHLC